MSRTPDFILGDEFAKVLTETTMSLVCVLDQDARILFFNDACERVTGFSRGEVVGCDARDFVIPQEEAETFKEVLDYIWKTGLSSPQVGHWLTKDGKRKLIAWSNRLMPSENGRPALLVTSGIDLSGTTPGGAEEARSKAAPRRSSRKSAGSHRSSVRSGASRRSSRPRRAPSECSRPCRRRLRACSR